MENLLQKLWENPFLRYSFVFLGSVLYDFLISLYTFALSREWMGTQALAGFILPFVSLVSSIWFIETKSFVERFRLTFVSALGMVVGSSATLLLFGS